jgi:hypothetical protein
MTEAIPTAEHPHAELVNAQVEYLPASQPYQHRYPDSTPLATVRTDSMAFFGVSDHRDRDTHEFFLTYAGQRITNLSQTLEQLVGDKHDATFDLVEQITQGAK